MADLTTYREAVSEGIAREMRRDLFALSSVQRTSRLIIVEENPYQGGWGGTVASVVADEGFESLDAPIRRVAAACVPLPFADALERGCAFTSVG
jgi:pyruvate/2-oxoglutarate/acetoin dehydrogenase E1 component